MYRSPQQSRSQETERAFLSAFQRLLAEQGFASTTVNDLAKLSGHTRSAFLSRFGSKEAALFLLFDAYCVAVTALMDEIAIKVPSLVDAYESVHLMSTSFEVHLTQHFGSNRAMHELFLVDLKVDERTQRIFRQLVDLMRQVQKRHLPDCECTDVGAYSAAQMLVTTNYNYVLKAMPALPRDPEVRHRMIAAMVVEALKF